MALISQTDLERRFTPLRIQRMADDVGDGSTIVENIEEATEEASDIAIAILRPAYKTIERIEALAAVDRSVRGAVSDIAIDLLARRKAEFLGQDGRTLFAETRRNAESVLKRMKGGDLRPGGEESAGVGANSRVVGVAPNVSTAKHPFTFIGPPKTNPRGGVGGF